MPRKLSIRTILSLLLGFLVLLAVVQGALGIDATRQYSDKMQSIAAVSDAGRVNRADLYRQVNALQAEADAFHTGRMELMMGITALGVVAALAAITIASAYLAGAANGARRPKAMVVASRPSAQLLQFPNRGFRPTRG